MSVRKNLKQMVMAAIGFYKEAISPYLGHHCRFTPTCSVYAREAIETGGLASGFWRATKRLLRCHPFHRGGFDPVPK